MVQEVSVNILLSYHASQLHSFNIFSPWDGHTFREKLYKMKSSKSSNEKDEVMMANMLSFTCQSPYTKLLEKRRGKSKWLIKFNWNHTTTESWQLMNTRNNSDSNTKDTGTGCTTCFVPICAERFHGNGYKLCTVLDQELLSEKYGAICVIRIASSNFKKISKLLS